MGASLDTVVCGPLPPGAAPLPASC
jgi:hypothetical protein